MTAEVPAELAAYVALMPSRRPRNSATISDRDDFTVGRAEVGLAVMQTFFADDVHENPEPPRGRIEMLPSGST
jgi:hypothetical protein